MANFDLSIDLKCCQNSAEMYKYTLLQPPKDIRLILFGDVAIKGTTNANCSWKIPNAVRAL